MPRFVVGWRRVGAIRLAVLPAGLPLELAPVTLGAVSRVESGAVLDPPALVKSRRHLAAGARAYRELNRAAMAMLEEEGVLVTCSCSHHLDDVLFRQVLLESARAAHRPFRVLDWAGESPDHPQLLAGERDGGLASPPARVLLVGGEQLPHRAQRGLEVVGINAREEVALTLETSGRDHIDRLLACLRAAGYRVEEQRI